MKNFCPARITKSADGLANLSHHWRLSEPQGPVTHGRCLRCGAEKEFSTAGPDSLPHTMSLKANRQRRTK